MLSPRVLWPRDAATLCSALCSALGLGFTLSVSKLYTGNMIGQEGQ